MLRFSNTRYRESCRGQGKENALTLLLSFCYFQIRNRSPGIGARAVSARRRRGGGCGWGVLPASAQGGHSLLSECRSPSWFHPTGPGSLPLAVPCAPHRWGARCWLGDGNRAAQGDSRSWERSCLLRATLPRASILLSGSNFQST